MTIKNYTNDEIENLVKQATDKAYENFREKKFKIAVVIAEQLLKIDPENTLANQILGLSYSALSRHQEAIATLKNSLEINPQNAETINDLALAYSNCGNYDESICHLESALKIKPEMAILHSNLGLQYRHKKNYEQALKHYDNALSLKREPTTLAMIGGCYGELKKLDEAEKYLREAISLNPDFAAAHVDLASVLQLKGKWEEGFAEYEYRFEVYDQLQVWKNLYDSSRKWKGQNLNGKRIMVHTEQGHGDAIQFVRYLKGLRENGAYTILHCSENLKKIFESLADEIYTKEPNTITADDLPEYDYYCSAVSLPHITKIITTYNSYIEVDKKFDLSKYNEFLKIGIVWAGNPQHPNDFHRSCKLEYFKTISEIPQVKLFSLMKDTRPRKYINNSQVYDLTENCENMNIVDLSSHINNFEDTASIINSLDLVVGVDTAVLHLAGAMGKPCIMLLPWNCDWRWEADGDVTLWYISMILLRQDSKDDWLPVFDNLKQKIVEILNEKRTCHLDMPFEF